MSNEDHNKRNINCGSFCFEVKRMHPGSVKYWYKIK
jgi:hypothetical protein